MFAVGAIVMCLLPVTVDTEIGPVVATDSKATGTVNSIGDKLLSVDFSKYADKNYYPGDYKRTLIPKDSCVPMK